ncbi:MAG: hypothetical protein ABW189_07640 [Rickettsiales bacterium]
MKHLQSFVEKHSADKNLFACRMTPNAFSEFTANVRKKLLKEGEELDQSIKDLPNDDPIKIKALLI